MVKLFKEGISISKKGNTDKHDHHDHHLAVGHPDHRGRDHHDHHHGDLVVKQWEDGPSQRVGGGGAELLRKCRKM